MNVNPLDNTHTHTHGYGCIYGDRRCLGYYYALYVCVCVYVFFNFRNIGIGLAIWVIQCLAFPKQNFTVFFYPVLLSRLHLFWAKRWMWRVNHGKWEFVSSSDNHESHCVYDFFVCSLSPGLWLSETTAARQTSCTISIKATNIRDERWCKW